MIKQLSSIHESRAGKRFKNRILLVGSCIVIASSIIFARLIYLQIFQHHRYQTLSNKNRISLIQLSPSRGLIYDRNGILLAENVPVFSLEIAPDQVENIQSTLANLRKIISISESESSAFLRRLKQRRRYETVPIRLELDDTEIATFSVNQHNFPGVFIKARLRRFYPLRSAFVHILGYVANINEEELRQPDKRYYSSSDLIGKIGIEKYYENKLYGKPGYEKVETDANGRLVRVLERVDPLAGDDIYLTLDARLQNATINAMGDRAGSIVMLDPNNGEVLALASTPSYDPNEFVQGISQQKYNDLLNSQKRPLYNRAISGQYPPASTIKPFIAIGALDNKVISPDYVIYDPGWFKLPDVDHYFRDWKHTGHGWIHLHRAIVVSCDTFFYNLAMMMGAKLIQSTLKQFGFGQYSGIDLGGERPGIAPTPEWKLANKYESWYSGDTILTGIGQGFSLTTPLQLASATAALAMRGQRFQPQLLFKRVSSQQQTFYTTPKYLPAIKLSDDTVWNHIINAMDEVTTTLEGTGRRFATNIGYTVAAKTGTAQIISTSTHAQFSNNSLPEHLRDHSLFIAFAPIEDPKIVVAVVVENNSDAPFVAREVMDYYFSLDDKA